MLKGKTEIILTDAHGNEERYVEENMLTGALNSVYNGNPYAILSSAHKNQTKSAGMSNYDMVNTCGGVLCFPESIEEDASHIYEPATNYPTAYASNDPYTGTDKKRGSYSTTSQYVTNGYKFVWDFTTDQGNGVISCICLTHVKGGKTYIGNLGELINFAQLDNSNTDCWGEIGRTEHPVARKIKMVLAYNANQLVVLDNDNKIGIMSVKVDRVNFDSIFSSNAFVEKMSAPSCNFIVDGSEFYTITATATSINWTKYNINCEQIGSGSWSFNGTNFYKSNSRYVFTKIGNYIYIPNTSLNTVYKCNISNTADVISIAGSTPATSYGDCLRAIGELVYSTSGVIGADDVFRASSTKISQLPFRRHGVWLLGYSEINYSSSNQYQSIGRSLQTNYLATINNLAKPINKTADKTMKIIYTLTEEN